MVLRLYGYVMLPLQGEKNKLRNCGSPSPLGWAKICRPFGPEEKSKIKSIRCRQDFCFHEKLRHDKTV